LSRVLPTLDEENPLDGEVIEVETCRGLWLDHYTSKLCYDGVTGGEISTVKYSKIF
jgi:hypothetical protein